MPFKDNTDFFISDKAIRKAKLKIKRIKYMNLCLNTRTCPVCSGDLNVTMDADRNQEYICAKCQYIWPRKQK